MTGPGAPPRSGGGGGGASDGWRAAALHLAARLVPFYLLALAAGALADHLGVPLGWVLGALVATAALAIAGVPIAGPVQVSRTAQLVIGAAIGLQVTPAVAAQMTEWLWLMVLAAAANLALAVVAAQIWRRLARVEPATGFFAMLPGGVAEMAQVGLREGADLTLVAVVQASRVALVVLVLPALLILAIHAPDLPQGLAPDTRPGLTLPFLALTLGLALAGAMLGMLVRLSNAWLLGPLLAVAAAEALGLLPQARMPPVLLAVAQAGLGFALGARFRRQAVGRAPRAIAMALAVLLVLGGSAIALALLAAAATGLPAGTLILGFAIGGMSEMVLTATLLGLDPTLVTAFQAVRAALVNASAAVLWRRLLRPPPPPP